METAIVSLVCIALIVFGGMALVQGFMTSTDSTALSMEAISVRDGEIMRTELTAVSSSLPASDNLQMTLENSGQIKLASFSKWDVIVQYYDAVGNYYVKWLPYVEGTPGDNEWQKSGIYLNGQAETFEPDILNPEEQMVLEAKLNPAVGLGTANVTITTPNGISLAMICSAGMTAHSETTTINGTGYYQLKSGTPADGTAITETTDAIAKWQTGRWLMHNESEPARLAKHVNPLAGVDMISASTWTVYYRGQALGNWGGQFGDASLSIDIIIRKSDGTIRATIATDVAEVVNNSGTWATVSATYDFAGYTVVDDTDYLEIDFYGKSSGKGPQTVENYIQLRVDDGGLAQADQTRIEGLSYS